MKNLDELINKAKAKGLRKIVVAAADDLQVLQAIQQGIESNIISPLLVGQKSTIISIASQIGLDLKSIYIEDEADPFVASKKAVQLIKESKGEIIMKGMVGTAPFLKAILNKENGLKYSGLLSHLALCECDFYHKVIGITDVAINIAPTFNDKINILKNSLIAYNKLGYTNPKVAIICPVEVVNEKIESTVHASMLTLMNMRNQLTDCIIDGPLALDVAISKEAAKHKGISGEVAGDADLLLVPELNSGNILYKSFIIAARAKTAAIVLGTQIPIVLTSRSDSDTSKLLSIAFAALID